MVHRTNGGIFDRNEDGDYKVTIPERIANIYARKQTFYTENKVFPYAKIYSNAIPTFKEDDIFTTIIPLIAQESPNNRPKTAQ